MPEPVRIHVSGHPLSFESVIEKDGRQMGLVHDILDEKGVENIQDYALRPIGEDILYQTDMHVPLDEYTSFELVPVYPTIIDDRDGRWE